MADSNAMRQKHFFSEIFQPFSTFLLMASIPEIKVSDGHSWHDFHCFDVWVGCRVQAFCWPWAYSSDKHGKRVIWLTVDAIRPSVSISSADRYFGAQSPVSNFAIGFESVSEDALVTKLLWPLSRVPLSPSVYFVPHRTSRRQSMDSDCHNFLKEKMIFNSLAILSGTESTRGLKSTGNDEINSTV